MGEYEKVKFSRSKIEKIGKIIADNKNMPIDEIPDEYMQVVDNWRAAHAYPLDVITSEIEFTLQTKMKAEYNNLIISRRLKRLDSIVGKLQRANHTALYGMQDLGGCRIITSTVDDVYKIIGIIKEDLIEKGHSVKYEYDYINAPRENSGYRSFHLVVECNDNPDYNKLKMLVEIQVRTKLEHYWATAVETIDCIQSETLKSGTGNPLYTQFFKLVSALFSFEENTPAVAGAPETKQSVVEQIYAIEKKKRVRETLGAVSQAVKLTGTYPETAGYFLLILNSLTRFIEIRAFEQNNIERATQMYQEQEKKYSNNNSYNVVLVSIRDISCLLDSYPNYYMNTKSFLAKLHELCSEYPEKPQMHIDISINTTNVLELFSIEYHHPCTSPEGGYTEEGIGIVDSNLILCPSWAITLNNSYLRFSGIGVKDDYLSENKGISPITVHGPGIVVLSSGASYYVNKQHWNYITDANSLLLKPKTGTDPSFLVLLISWLKSNLFTWDLLWNKHIKSAYYLPDDSIVLPTPDSKVKDTIIQLTQEIINMENTFVSNCPVDRNQITQESIDVFNTSVHEKLRMIESLFADYYHLSKDEREKISLEIKMKGYYSYLG